MRNLPGWVVGALGACAVAGAFHLGGRLAASELSPTPVPVGHVAAPSTAAQYSSQPLVAQPYYTAPAPRMVRTSSVRIDTSAPVQRNRTTKKSVAIIAGSTAAGAGIGGLTKGKKGALIGGLIGGGAATIWDQATRRKRTR